MLTADQLVQHTGAGKSFSANDLRGLLLQHDKKYDPGLENDSKGVIRLATSHRLLSPRYATKAFIQEIGSLIRLSSVRHGRPADQRASSADIRGLFRTACDCLGSRLESRAARVPEFSNAFRKTCPRTPSAKRVKSDRAHRP